MQPFVVHLHCNVSMTRGIEVADQRPQCDAPSMNRRGQFQSLYRQTRTDHSPRGDSRIGICPASRRECSWTAERDIQLQSAHTTRERLIHYALLQRAVTKEPPKTGEFLSYVLRPRVKRLKVQCPAFELAAHSEARDWRQKEELTRSLSGSEQRKMLLFGLGDTGTAMEPLSVRCQRANLFLMYRRLTDQTAGSETALTAAITAPFRAPRRAL